MTFPDFMYETDAETDLRRILEVAADVERGIRSTDELLRAIQEIDRNRRTGF